jgi:hypothetical protein
MSKSFLPYMFVRYACRLRPPVQADRVQRHYKVLLNSNRYRTVGRQVRYLTVLPVPRYLPVLARMAVQGLPYLGTGMLLHQLSRWLCQSALSSWNRHVMNLHVQSGSSVTHLSRPVQGSLEQQNNGRPSRGFCPCLLYPMKVVD